MNEWVLEKEATSFRLKYGLSGIEAIRLKSLLQKLNVVTVFMPLSSGFSGMAIKVSKNEQEADRFMLVNNTQSIGKQHFTICHELYHLFVQSNFSSQICLTGLFDKKANKEEYYADVFASYLLLPSDGLLTYIPSEELQKKRISLKTVLYLEQYFSCSRSALLYRLKSAGYMQAAEYDTYKTGVKRSALENGYPVDIYNPGNEHLVIGDYGSLAKELFDKNELSQSHYYSLLSDIGIDITKLEENSNGE